MSRRVDVRVPGSVIRSNEGVATAADRWVKASFAFDGGPQARIERGGTLLDLGGPPDTDWVLDGFRAACADVGRDPPATLRTRAVSDIPLGAELGAAVAATVAGIIGARALLALPLDDDAVVRIARGIDGSAERIAASVAGHYCAVHPACDAEP